MNQIRISVVGAGANGASIGADLIAAGLDATLVEQWPAHVEAMRSDGLLIVHADGETRLHPRVLHLCEVAELRERFDVVFLLMKAYDATWATQLIEPYLAPDGLVVAVQNGMTTAAVASVVGEARTMGTVIEVSSTMSVPGVVHRHTPPARSWFAVGARAGGPAARVEGIATLLRHSGTVDVVDDIESTKWMKLVSNSLLLVPSAILGLPMLDALHTEGMREIMLRAGQEALDVGIARGHAVLPIFGLAPSDVEKPDQVVEALLEKLFSGFVVPGATTTVLQDWTKGRHSEVDDINGLVMVEGARLGTPTPLNTAIVEVAHRIERGELAPDAAHLELLRAG